MRAGVAAGLIIATGLAAACARPVRISQSVVPADRSVMVTPILFTLQFGPEYSSADEAIAADDAKAVLGFRGVAPPVGRGDAGIAERAASFDKTKSLAAMLDAGVDPDTRDERDNTLLHRAVESGAVESTVLLLDRGADIDARNKSGWTPLNLATFRSDEKIFKLLLARGADITVPDQEGFAVLDHPCLAAEKRALALQWIAEVR